MIGCKAISPTGEGEVVDVDAQEIAIKWTDAFGWQAGWSTWYTTAELEQYHIEIQMQEGQEELNYEINNHIEKEWQEIEERERVGA